MNPINYIGGYLLRNQKDFKEYKSLDLGCGEGRLYEFLKTKNCSLIKDFRSFDLQSTKPFIEVCDISKLPIEDESINITVFCLSLMGTNFS